MYFEVDFSLHCHYAGEIIIEDLYHAMASDLFNTGQILVVLAFNRDNSLHLAIFQMHGTMTTISQIYKWIQAVFWGVDAPVD